MATLRWNWESEVNTTIAGYQSRGRVAALDDGGYVVVWEAERRTETDTISRDIRARIFDSAGQPLTDEFTVATGTDTVFHANPDVVGRNDSGFQVVWTQNAGDLGGRSIASAQFAPRVRDNTIVFELQRNFDVTTPLAGRQDDTAAIARTDSGVAITWQRQGVQGPLLLTPTSGSPVFVEQFVASGTADFNATPAIATQRGGAATRWWRGWTARSAR